MPMSIGTVITKLGRRSTKRTSSVQTNLKVTTDDVVMQKSMTLVKQNNLMSIGAMSFTFG